MNLSRPGEMVRLLVGRVMLTLMDYIYVACEPKMLRKSFYKETFDSGSFHDLPMAGARISA